LVRERAETAEITILRPVAALQKVGVTLHDLHDAGSNGPQSGDT
jgi:hypothetical protein